MSTNIKNRLKASYKKSVKTALSDISAMNTMLNNYPVSTNTNPLISEGSYDNSVNFSISILRILGVTEDEIVDFFVSLFKSDNEGFLNAIETAVKAVLMANVKKFFDCDINPLIPNSLIEDTNGGVTQERGIRISLDDIDMMRVLDKSPFEKDWSTKRNRIDLGSNYYFDVEGYTPNDVWKSTDFNAYLWYITNRDMIDNRRALYWDNRNIGGVSEYLGADKDVKNEFYGDFAIPNKGCELLVTKDKKVLKRFPIIKCQYLEGDGINTEDSVHVLISDFYSDRKIRGIDYDKIRANATVFEFNRDFINSIKLFDRKTLISSIVNSIYGITASITVNMTDTEKVIRGYIENAVREIIRTDSTEITDCYFKFSDKEYIEALRRTEEKYANRVRLSNGRYEAFSLNDGDIEEINRLISELEPKDGGVLCGEEETVAIKAVFSNVISKIKRDNGSVDSRYADISFGSFIVDKLLTETVQEIVMSLLSPKVGFLFLINSAVMGDLLNVDGREDFKIKGWKDFIENMPNLIADIVVKVKDVLLSYIKREIADTLSPKLLLYELMLLKESVDYWKRLLKQVATSCAGSFNAMLKRSGNVYTTLDIDNVSGADIYEEDIKTVIKKTEC